jgi:hypothetical protein
MYRRHVPFIAFDSDTGAGGGGGADPEKKFTQADVDKIVQTRVAKLTTDLAAATTKIAELEPAAAELAKLKADGQSDTQRLQTELDKVKADLATAKDAGEKAAEAAKVERRRNAVIALAAAGVDIEGKKARAADPGDVWALLTEAQKNAVTIGDDGQVTGADEAVKTLLAAKPHLVGTQQIKPDPAQGPRGNSTEKSVAAGREMFESRKGAKSTTTPTT